MMAEPIELKRYMGTWYEVKRSYNSFQRKCVENTTTATYTLLNDGKTIRVENACKTSTGLVTSVGEAWQVGPRQLRVSFFRYLPRILSGIFSRSYNIVYISKDYRYAVVRSGRLWWILSRNKNVASKQLDILLEKVKS